MDPILTLQQYPYFAMLLLILLASAVGSFLNVVIYRLPIMLQRSWESEAQQILQKEASELDNPNKLFNLCTPRSACPNCQKTIKARHNIPIISYLFLRGRCTYCEQNISWRYPAVELSAILISALLALQFGFTWQLFAGLIFCWSLLCLIMIDIDHQLLPDSITLPILWLGLLINLNGVFVDIQHAIIGAIAGYLSLWTFTQLFKFATGKVGMGNGDFKLFALFGAWLGWELLPFIIISASLIGAIVGMLILFIRGQDRNVPIPFGPFLGTAGIVALLWGNEITTWYLQYSGLMY